MGGGVNLETGCVWGWVIPLVFFKGCGFLVLSLWLICLIAGGGGRRGRGESVGNVMKDT